MYNLLNIGFMLEVIAMKRQYCSNNGFKLENNGNEVVKYFLPILMQYYETLKHARSCK